MQQADAAHNYPVKPVRFIVPFTPGAINDFLGRLLAQKMSEVWGQQVVVDNRAGGGTLIGTEMAAKSPPDGYTLLLYSMAHALNPSLYAKLPFDSRKDFAYVSLIASAPFLLVVNPALPAKSMTEFIALAKAKPGRLTYGSPGNGTQGHLVAELFKRATGIDIRHVPYKGASVAVIDVVAGYVDSLSTTLTTAGSQIRSGRLRALALSSSERLSEYAHVPTYRELGFPQLVATVWFSISGPAGMPTDIVNRLNGEIRRVLQLPDVRERLRSDGIESGNLDPQAFSAFVAEEIKRWSPVIRASGARPD